MHIFYIWYKIASFKHTFCPKILLVCDSGSEIGYITASRSLLQIFTR